MKVSYPITVVCRLEKGRSLFCMKLPVLLLALITMASLISGQQVQRRGQGEWLYTTESGNTPGAWNVWGSGTGIGYIWDAISISRAGTYETKPLIRPFLEVRGTAGLFDFIDFSLGSRVLSFPWNNMWQFGNIWGSLKCTYPNNKKLRLHNPAVYVKYGYSFLHAFESIAGYRDNGTGFTAEGLIVEGGSIEARAVYELDFISIASWLPLKFIINNGLRVPLTEKYQKPFMQYLVNSAIIFSGLSVDVYLEYSFEGLVNNSLQPKLLRYSDMGWAGGRIFEVAFMENPMYLIPGGRFRWESGVTAYCFAPLLLSKNSGSAMTLPDKLALSNHSKFAREWERGVTDPFDPWYTKWKVVAGISIPLIYRQTAAEMMRNFLLLKNRPQGGKKIDLDEKIRGDTKGGKKTKAQLEEEDKKKRLDDIQKRRDEAQQ